jgi:hypothetical protein
VRVCISLFMPSITVRYSNLSVAEFHKVILCLALKTTVQAPLGPNSRSSANHVALFSLLSHATDCSVASCLTQPRHADFSVLKPSFVLKIAVQSEKDVTGCCPLIQ